MCGRYSLTKNPNDLSARLGTPSLVIHPRYNVAPTQQGLVVVNESDPAFKWMRWGLIPSWAKDEAIGNKLINARCETAAEKPAFRSSFRSRRCLVPADGFYEWRKAGKLKTPMRIVMKDDSVFCMAGLWAVWKNPSEETVESFSVLTAEPNELMKTIHNRMPVILREDQYATWLDSDSERQALMDCCREPFPAERMKAYPVNPCVNNARRDGPECLEPATVTKQMELL